MGSFLDRISLNHKRKFQETFLTSTRPHYKSFFADSARWNDFPFREGDIVICTPPKCGTTWMQMICALLIFQDVNIPQSLTTLSPWLDMMMQPKDEVYSLLEAQANRRFIKTHTPLDGLPRVDGVTYICVGRDPRDVAMSIRNHGSNMDMEVFERVLKQVNAGDNGTEIELPERPEIPETTEGHFWSWVDKDSPILESGSALQTTFLHFDLALKARHEPNVVVMHYANMKADLEGEMRRLAARLAITVAEEKWPILVEAASFASMKSRATELAPNANQKVWKEDKQFFHSGTGGHWREFWNDEAQARYDARVDELTTSEVASWALNGRV